MNTRHVPRSLIWAFVLAAGLFLPAFTSRAPQPPPASTLYLPFVVTINPNLLPLLQQSDLTYIGAFRVPHQDGQNNPLGYSGHALGYNPAHHSLFYGGHDWYQLLCEIGIPATIDLSHTGTILQDCTDVTEGRLDQVDDYTVKLGGTLIYDGRLIVSAYSYYDADGNQSVSHFASSTDLSQMGDIQGPYAVGDWAGIVSGYMTTIPAEWRAALGGPALTGQCCISIISRTSAGPAVSAFDPDLLGSAGPLTAIPLLYYPLAHPLREEDTQNDYFNLATNIKGVAFPAGTRSVLFFGRQGTGPYCYGTGGMPGKGIATTRSIRRKARIPILTCTRYGPTTPSTCWRSRTARCGPGSRSPTPCGA